MIATQGLKKPTGRMANESVYVIEVASPFRCPSPSPTSVMLHHCTSDRESLGPNCQNVPHNGDASLEKRCSKVHQLQINCFHTWIHWFKNWPPRLLTKFLLVQSHLIKMLKKSATCWQGAIETNLESAVALMAEQACFQTEMRGRPN